MIELAKHIEVLLLENDCVIVPGLGGFIAHNRPASYSEKTNEFNPPIRTIGFNPQLIINDGLLAQSYMQAYNTDFPDATRKIEKVVMALKDQLYQEGHVVLEQIGTLYYNMNGVYEFEPFKNTFFSPSLYGLEKISLPRLAELQTAKPDTLPRIEVQQKKTAALWDEKQWERILSAKWMQHAMAVAATVFLFFICSTPVENTYVDEANYASLGSTSMFDAIRNQSLITSYIETEQTDTKQEKKKSQQDRPKNNVNTLKPVSVKTVKVATEEPATAPKQNTSPNQEVKEQSAPQASQPEAVPESKKTAKAETKEPVEKAPKKSDSASAKKGSYIIVASLQTAADAEKQAEAFRKQGYKNAQVVASNGRYRVALSRHSNASEAYKEIKTIKASSQFKDAWVYTAK